jgi:hypothetical protein
MTLPFTPIFRIHYPHQHCPRAAAAIACSGGERGGDQGETREKKDVETHVEFFGEYFVERGERGGMEWWTCVWIGSDEVGWRCTDKGGTKFGLMKMIAI